MLEFYTNIFREKGNLFVRGYDHNGLRENKVVKYKPYLFVPSPKETEFKNLNNQNLAKIDFENIYEAQQFIKKYKDVANFSLFGFDRFEYSFISDNFKKINYDYAKISTVYLDIEVVCREGFPSPDKADHEISVISIRKNNKIYVFATKQFNNKNSDVVFFYCKNEEELLTKFLTVWEKLDVDIITGWNIEGFDIPYLINRITKLFSFDIAVKLSPWRKITSKIKNLYNKEIVYFNIHGISILDYLPVYKKFCPQKRDSYSLNNICYIELEEKKIDYSDFESLNDLWDKDSQKYIEYNIHDTNLVYKLENKLKYIERSVAVSYDAKVNFNDALTSVLLWEVIIMNFLKKKNIVVPLKSSHFSKESIEGAYVKPPQIKLFDWVVSFDLTSLYPHIIMGWNISPETVAGKVLITIDDILNENFNKQMLKDKNVCLAGNGCLYDISKIGHFSSLMEEQFNQRTQYKKKMLSISKEYEETKNEDLKNEITKYDNYQYGKKIQINSAYGAIANNYFKFYSKDNAEAITYTGQVIIKWVEIKINQFLNKYFKSNNIDYVIASDTDSLYLNLNEYVSTLNKTNKNEILESLDKFSEEVLTKQFNKIFNELTEILNCPKNKLHMKRESIAEKAIWRAKKNYAAYIWDNEGVRYTKPKLKIMGMEAVRSSTPEVCRKKFKEIVELMFTEGEEKVQEEVLKFEHEYLKLPLYDIARSTSVNDYSSYEDGNDGYIKGAGINIKAAILYNTMIDKLKLTNKYRYIKDGDKIKYLDLVKLNPIGDDVIGAPDGNFPQEFNIEPYIDKHYMFEKTFLNPIQSLLASAGWNSKKQNNLNSFFGG